MKKSAKAFLALGIVFAVLGAASLANLDTSTAWSSSHDTSLPGSGSNAPAIKASLGGYTLYLPAIMKPPGPIYLPLVAKPAPSPTPTRTATPIANPVKNGGFEDTTVSWFASLTYEDDPNNPIGVDLRHTLQGTGASPHAGSWAAWLGGYPFGARGYRVELWQNNITIPAGGTTLQYWAWIQSDEPICSVDYDFVWVYFSSNQNNVVESYPLCTSARTSGWVKREINLSGYVGQTGWLGFVVRILGANSNLFIDDVALGTLTGAPLPAQTPIPAGSKTPTP
jgi:hypothetical protein